MMKMYGFHNYEQKFKNFKVFPHRKIKNTDFSLSGGTMGDFFFSPYIFKLSRIRYNYISYKI